MAGVHGERLYGYVDRVPGLFRVATMFFHFNFVPIFPMGTYLVTEGPTAQAGFQGLRINLNLKSVLVGYFRGWVGLASIVLFAVCGIQSCEAIFDTNPSDAVRALTIAIAVVAYGSVWWAMIAYHRSWIVAWFVVLGATGGYFAWDSANPLPPKPANPFKAPFVAAQRHRDGLPDYFVWANGCLLSLVVLRTFDRASRGRAIELGERIGIDEEHMLEILNPAAPDIADPPRD
jgi:hypothetical protein